MASQYSFFALRRSQRNAFSQATATDSRATLCLTTSIAGEDKLGCFMLNNAASNIKVVNLSVRQLFPSWTQVRRLSRRLRYFGRVTSLGA